MRETEPRQSRGTKHQEKKITSGTCAKNLISMQQTGFCLQSSIESVCFPFLTFLTLPWVPENIFFMHFCTRENHDKVTGTTADAVIYSFLFLSQQVMITGVRVL